jgi:2-amino-4-hydroxy-6-hydroxymethyldihydropteridine diphosphokinase
MIPEGSIFLSIGSNQGRRDELLKQAVKRIGEQAGKVFVQSSVYETEAWGNESLAPFLNQVIGIESMLGPMELLRVLLDIEKSLGRIRSSVRWQERTIDIDILFYQDLEIINAELQIPHAGIYQRKFVLAPLAEIAPEWKDKKSGKTIQELLEACPDQLGIIKRN